MSEGQRVLMGVIIGLVVILALLLAVQALAMSPVFDMGGMAH